VPEHLLDGTDAVDEILPTTMASVAAGGQTVLAVERVSTMDTAHDELSHEENR